MSKTITTLLIMAGLVGGVGIAQAGSGCGQDGADKKGKEAACDYSKKDCDDSKKDKASCGDKE